MGDFVCNFVIICVIIIFFGSLFYFLYHHNSDKIEYMKQLDSKTDDKSDKNIIKKYIAPKERDNEVTIKKKKYIKASKEEIDDLFDVEQLLPQEINKDWFDVEALQDTRNINNSNLLNPKFLFGIDTIGNTLKNPTHDIRGDIYIPKKNVGPWNQSSYDSNEHMRGLCN